MKRQQKIISLLRSDNEKGIVLLYDHYASTLLGFINGIVDDISVSEEILQTVFLKIYNNFHQYDEQKSSLFTWIVSIARNSAIDRVRLKSFQNRKKTDSLDSIVYDVETTKIETAAIDSEKLLSVLEEKYKVVLDMIYLKGYTQMEVSEILELPLGTVKTRIRAAINILRKELNDEKDLFLGIFLFILSVLIVIL